MRLKILGPPGTGKTTKVLEYIEKFYADPNIGRIVFCSFTNAAIDEAKNRMAAAGISIYHKHNNPEGRIQLSTIHSLLFQHMNHEPTDIAKPLWQFAKWLGQPLDNVYDMFGFKAATPLEKAIGYYNALRCRMMHKDQTRLPEGLDWMSIKGYISGYESWKSRDIRVDQTDILVNYLKRGEAFPHDVAIVDEAQDLSLLQWNCVNKMFANAKHFYTVGDDDQTIFGFAGTRAVDFTNWPCDKTEVLDHSFRLGKVIQDYSKKVLARMSSRMPKVFTPRPGKSTVMFTSAINPETDIFPYATCAILHRNEYLAGDIKRRLNDMGVMYKGKKSPFNAKKPKKAVLWWEQWRKGRQMYGKHMTGIFQFIPTSVDIPRFEEIVGRKGIAPPCPCPDLPWHKVLEFEEKKAYMNVQKLQGIDYLITDPVIEITTIHQAKGGEWDKIILMTDMAGATWKQLNNGTIEEQDEEHRVWYVALTRAKHVLQIIKPRTTSYYPLEEI